MNIKNVIVCLIFLLMNVQSSMMQQPSMGCQYSRVFVEKFLEYLQRPYFEKVPVMRVLNMLGNCIDRKLLLPDCLNIQGLNGNTLLHGLAKLGDPELFGPGLRLRLNPMMKNKRCRTAEDILHEKRLRFKRLKRNRETAARYAQCLKLYKNAYSIPDKEK